MVELNPGYSIRVVSRLTGLSAETLRIWERRYGFPKPERTESGRRVYGDADVAQLQLILKALSAGYRPHEVVASDAETLQRLVGEASPTGRPITVSEVVTALRADDAPGVDALLRQAIAFLGPKRFLTELVAPLLVRIGEDWAAGTLAVRHEHLISECLGAQIHILLGQYPPSDRRPLVLLATLPDELHGLGLEMIALYITLLGGEARVLGPNLAAEQIAQAAKALDVDVVGLSVSVGSDPQAVSRDLQALLPELPRRMEIWLGGAGAPQVALPEDGVRLVGDWAALEKAFQRASAGRI